MRYALISDIRANLPALEAVLDDVAARPDIDAIYHLGDLVGYGPWPNEVVALLRTHAVQGIQGNKDSKLAAAARQESASGATAVDWTQREVTGEHEAALSALPFRIDLRPRGGHIPGPTVILVHGTPELNTRYWRQESTDAFCLEMASLANAKRGDVICFGHTHIPWHREVDGIHFVNTGSVGRPKDGDWRAGYVTLEMRGDIPHVEFVRVEYDLERAINAIRDSELPATFADFLRSGGQPEDEGGAEPEAQGHG